MEVADEDFLTCRICLDVTKDYVDMTTPFNKINALHELEQKFPNNKFTTAVTYWDCFQLCTFINLPINEHIMMVLCKDCAENLLNAYENLCKSHLSELLLQELSLKFKELENSLLNEEEFDNKSSEGVKYMCSTCYDSFPSRMQLDDHFSYRICKESDIVRTLKEIEVNQNTSPASFDDTQISVSASFDDTQLNVTPIYEKIKIEIIEEPGEEKPKLGKKKLVGVSKENNAGHKKPPMKRKEKKKIKLNVNERPTFECDICGKIYFHERSVLIHKRIHSGDTIPCEVCGKGFVNSKELSVHMRFHNRDYPFVCELCGLKYACMGHLRTHLLKHQGLKFQCEECDKLFASLKGLNEHRVVHTGSMPFPCSYCDRGYPSKHKYKMHLKNVHKVDPTLEEIVRSEKSSKLPKKRLRHTPKLVEVK